MRTTSIITVEDRRHLQPNPPALVRGVQKCKIDPRTKKAFVRKPSAIDGIVIHQTACSFGPSDDAEARHSRAHHVACHALGFRDGTIVLPNPFLWQINHGNGFNDRALGLELEGLFSGLKDDPRTVPKEDVLTTWGGKPDVVTELLVATGKRALEVMVAEAAKEGITLRYIWAHRQSSGTRRSDPGQEIWERVVLDHAVKVMGLVTQPTVFLQSKSSGPGRTIPKAWDPSGVGRY